MAFLYALHHAQSLQCTAVDVFIDCQLLIRYLSTPDHASIACQHLLHDINTVTLTLRHFHIRKVVRSEVDAAHALATSARILLS